MIYLYYQIKLISLGLKGLHVTSLYPQFWMKDPQRPGRRGGRHAQMQPLGGRFSGSQHWLHKEKHHRTQAGPSQHRDPPFYF